MSIDDFVIENLGSINEIKQSNEIGDCHEIMIDLKQLFAEGGFDVSSMCLYMSESGEGAYISMQDVYTTPLPCMTTIENGNEEHEYVVHYVPVIGDTVIDINYTGVLDENLGFLFGLDEYIDLYEQLNNSTSENLTVAFE